MSKIYAKIVHNLLISQEATIIVYENEVLEELILKYQDVLNNFEIYFPSFKKCTYTDLALQNQLSFLTLF